MDTKNLLKDSHQTLDIINCQLSRLIAEGFDKDLKLTVNGLNQLMMIKENIVSSIFSLRYEYEKQFNEKINCNENDEEYLED